MEITFFFVVNNLGQLGMGFADTSNETWLDLEHITDIALNSMGGYAIANDELYCWGKPNPITSIPNLHHNFETWCCFEEMVFRVIAWQLQRFL